MCILQIGELVEKLSDDFRSKNSKMPWRDIKAMRNITAHNYGEILWGTATSDIPLLKDYCQSFIK